MRERREPLFQAVRPPASRLPLSPERLGRKHLGAAGGAKEDAVGEATHLGVATLLAGVAAEGLGEAGYPPEIPQDIAIQGAATSLAVGCGRIDQLHLAQFAVRTDDATGSRGRSCWGTPTSPRRWTLTVTCSRACKMPPRAPWKVPYPRDLARLAARTARARIGGARRPSIPWSPDTERPFPNEED